MNNPFETCHLESDKLRNSAQPENLVIESRIKDAQPTSDQTGGITNVELSRINTTEIKSAADFEDPAKYAALRREAGMLKQMQPALDQGANADTFDSWDKANRIGHYTPNGYVRGYTDVYHSYHGTEPVAVEPKGDGTFDVINGQHRIVAARDAGLTKIPARVV